MKLKFIKMKKIIILIVRTDSVSYREKPGAIRYEFIASGKITYEEKAKIEIKLEGDAAQFADQMPKEQVSSKVLFFNADYCIVPG